MPKLKTHKGIKKRFKISATGKVSHKRCGSSHLMSHKNGKQVRRLRKKSTLEISAEAHRVRRAVKQRQSTQPDVVEAEKLAAEIAGFPPIAMTSDRQSAYESFDRDQAHAILREMELSLEARRKESQSGAARFASGEGRHGKFPK